MLAKCRLAAPALAALLPLLPAAALAASATASQNLNVRSGPSTSYSVISQLRQGDSVDVRQCEGLFCQITFGGQSGWVSASYLTRDYVPRAPATTAEAGAADTVPPLSMPSSGAATAFPPAYDPAAGPDAAGPDAAAPNDLASADPSYDSGDPGADGGTYPDSSAISSVSLPPDSGDTVISVGAPRPKADVPGGAMTGPADEFTLGASPGAADTPSRSFEIPTPANDPPPGWADRFGRFGWRAGVGNADPATAGRACLLAEVGSRGLCVAAGQTVHGLARGGYSVAWLRNPAHLDVTICTTAGGCRNYRSSGPLRLVPGEAVSSISADDPSF